MGPGERVFVALAHSPDPCMELGTQSENYYCKPTMGGSGASNQGGDLGHPQFYARHCLDGMESINLFHF